VSRASLVEGSWDAKGINYLTGATIGFTTFGDGTATPLASAANFLNGTIRNNASIVSSPACIRRST
jgi:hypothetical protein